MENVRIVEDAPLTPREAKIAKFFWKYGKELPGHLVLEFAVDFHALLHDLKFDETEPDAGTHNDPIADYPDWCRCGEYLIGTPHKCRR